MAKRGFLAVLTAVLWTTAVSAHHPFSADFDMTQQITLTGNITKVEWQNPHVYAYLDVKNQQGKVVNWKVEMASPAELTKAGWTRTSLVSGEAVTVKAWKSKNNATLANADSFTVRGKPMNAASSFHAAPSDRLARADSRPLLEQTDLTAAPQPTGTSGAQPIGTSGTQETGTPGTQETGTAGTQDLPATASPLVWYALLGSLSLAGALGVRRFRR